MRARASAIERSGARGQQIRINSSAACSEQARHEWRGATPQANACGSHSVACSEQAAEQPDVEATNGVIHIIDSVLLPPAATAAGM
ncbi:MAG: fasciclin domain-containing protein [Pyrinomonadaceae bacterium]